MELTQLKKQLATHEYDERLGDIYGSSSKEIKSARERLEALVEWYAEEFGSVEGASDVALYTAPGRTEMGGNHTDHQQGAVLAGSVTLDMVACAAPNGTRTARIMSQGYPEITVDLRDLVPVAGEERNAASPPTRSPAIRCLPCGVKTIPSSLPESLERCSI